MGSYNRPMHPMPTTSQAPAGGLVDSLNPEQRAAVTPMVKADNPHGEWNTYEITMKGDRVSVKLNGKQVLKNAQLPGVPKVGPIALQHHGAWNEKQKRWTSPPSLVQFRNIYIKELK